MTSFTGINLYSLLYTTFFTLCSGFVLLSSAAGSNSNLKILSPGDSLVYQWKSVVLLNEIEETSKNVGFSLDGTVVVSSIWGNDHKKILKLELLHPKLHVKSRKAPEPEGFIAHSSNLNLYKNQPFVVSWNRGIIDKIFTAKDEEISLKNLKKGIAGLLQIQALDGEIPETDASGHCITTYTSISPSIISKTKLNCSSEDVTYKKHIDEILGTNLYSRRDTEFLIDDSGNFLKSIISKETHQLSFQANGELGGKIKTEQTLNYQETKPCDIIKAGSFEEAISEASRSINVIENTLLTEAEPLNDEIRKKKFNKELDLLRGNLKTENLGSLKAAKAFVDLLAVAKISSTEDIAKALGSKKNVNILSQIYDVLGYAQTKSSHQAVMKKLHLDDEEHADFLERYLWALSFSTHPNVDIVEDILNKYRKYTTIPDKVRDTLILSLASMSRTLALSKKPLSYETSKVLKTVEETISNGLDYAKDEDRYVFFNALRNMQAPSTIPKLISFVKNGNLKEEVLAWRALKGFGKDFWAQDILKLAERTLYQLDKKHDTSSRTISADILLGSSPNDDALYDLLNFVAGNETNYEIRQYVYQSIKMISEKCKDFHKRVENLIKGNRRLNNYASLSPRGLSTALTRNIFESISSNGSLVSVQEIKAGIVKRGLVDVVLQKDGLSKELFTLGIFASGLSSFTSSNGDENDDAEEAATAGMELVVMGTQIRPFVFFEGQGELMGHVWSGTASDMTPAFQALILMQDHEELLRLGNGFMADVNMKGAISLDLSGKIETSLWNRNAQSLIKQSVGYVANGLLQVDTSFVRSKVESEASIEPKLNLEIDADFSGNVKLCMRLSQPDSLFMHSISKVERIPGSKHQLKITKTKKTNVPGKTYALNRKNNEMCSAIFS